MEKGFSFLTLYINRKQVIRVSIGPHRQQIKLVYAILRFHVPFCNIGHFHVSILGKFLPRC